jgi:hypothetical protein
MVQDALTSLRAVRLPRWALRLAVLAGLGAALWLAGASTASAESTAPPPTLPGLLAETTQAVAPDVRALTAPLADAIRPITEPVVARVVEPVVERVVEPVVTDGVGSQTSTVVPAESGTDEAAPGEETVAPSSVALLDGAGPAATSAAGPPTAAAVPARTSAGVPDAVLPTSTNNSGPPAPTPLPLPLPAGLPAPSSTHGGTSAGSDGKTAVLAGGVATPSPEATSAPRDAGRHAPAAPFFSPSVSPD